MNCFICQPGPWPENHVCKDCEESMEVFEVNTLDLDAVHAQVWDDGTHCPECKHLTHGVSRRDTICMVSADPRQCQQVQHYLDIYSLVTLEPELMADFIAGVCHETDLAHVLVSFGGSADLNKQLAPLIKQWVESLTPGKINQYVRAIPFESQPENSELVWQQDPAHLRDIRNHFSSLCTVKES